MLILIKILVVVYFLAINVYSFLLLKSQKKNEDDGNCSKIRDGHLFVTAILGGALGIYVAMFILRFRTKSLFLMVFMPVIIVINLFFVIVGFINDFWVFNGIFIRQNAENLPFIDL